jgi:hypothetical protein
MHVIVDTYSQCSEADRYVVSSVVRKPFKWNPPRRAKYESTTALNQSDLTAGFDPIRLGSVRLSDLLDKHKHQSAAYARDTLTNELPERLDDSSMEQHFKHYAGMASWLPLAGRTLEA